ncbi:MAG: GAF domain-containing protein [Rhodocyclales bacterium]|nr:GAF domain-containing protein [Rhodocyclales bacterium]
MTQTQSGPDRNTQMERMQDRLDFARKLQILTNKIHGTDNVTQIMLDLSSEISELFQCERLTLYVYNKERGALVSKVKTGIDAGKDLVLPVNRQSIAGYVAATRSTVRIDDLNDAVELGKIDPELHFFNQVDTITGFKSRQMLAAPLLQGTNKELVGVLQLINQRADGRFDRVAEEGLEALTATLSLALAQRIKSTALLPKRYEVLAAEGVISAAELELAQRWAQRKNKDLEQVLVEDFHVALAAMGTAMAHQCALAYQPLARNWYPNAELAKKVNRANAEQQQWLPHSQEGNIVVLVTTEPDNRLNKQNMNRAFPYNELAVRFTTRTEFDRMLDQTWPGAR